MLDSAREKHASTLERIQLHPHLKAFSARALTAVLLGLVLVVGASRVPAASKDLPAT